MAAVRRSRLAGHQQCRVAVAALTDAGFVEMRLLKVVGLSI